MRLALVRLNPGLAASHLQMEAFRALRPDDYHVEEGANLLSLRRMVERLERLGPGDTLCLLALDHLRPNAAEALTLVAGLIARGVHVEVLAEAGEPLRIGADPRDREILSLFADLHRRHKDEAGGAAGGPAPELLTSDQVADIRRLFRAGLSPRRIGLIYRRSPDAICRLVWTDGRGAGDRAGGGRASGRRKTGAVN